MVRSAHAEPKATWAGGTPQASLARFKVRMTASRVERTPSRPFGCLDAEAIVETRGGCEKSGVQAVGNNTSRANTAI